MNSLSTIAHRADCLDCPLGMGGVCGSLSPEVRLRLADGAVMRDYPVNASICEGTGPSGFVGILISGYLRIQRFSIDGRRQIITLLTAGDLVGEGALSVEGCLIEAATPARICRLERRTFGRLLEEDHAMRKAVYGLRAAKLEQLRWLSWALGALGAEERICAFLAMATKYMPFTPMPDGGAILTVELPRADMADLMGTSVESISRITNSLAARGVIHILDARHFEIPDLGRLVKMGHLGAMFDTVSFVGGCAQRRAVGVGGRRVVSLRPMPGMARHGPLAPLAAIAARVESHQ